MLRSILSRFASLRETDETDESGADSNGGFRPSRLDASVLYAHGADVERVADEIADIEDRVGEIEDARREK